MGEHGDAILKGDINGNGVHDLTDVIIGLQISSGKTTTDINPNSDTNHDGIINVVESLQSLRKMQAN